MPSNYPSGTDSFVTRVDNTDKVMASHVNYLQDILAAIESTLGINPQGAFASVAARLASLAGVAADAIWSAKGQLAVGTGSHTATTLGVGSAGQKLTPNTSTATGLMWIPDKCGVSAILGDGINVLTAGVKGYIAIPYGFYIDDVRVVADVSGSVQVSIWRGAYADLPLTSGKSIVASAPIVLSSAVAGIATVTTWSRQCNYGEYFCFNVDSASTLHQVTIAIFGHKTDNS